MEGKPQTNYEQVERRKRYLVRAMTVTLLVMVAISMYGQHHWAIFMAHTRDEVSWASVIIYLAWLPMHWWFMRITPCVRCGMPLGKRASAIAVATDDPKHPTDCAHCGLRDDEQVS